MENEFDITKLGWPVAQPRFTRRPSASMKISCPSGKVYLSTCGLMFGPLESLTVVQRIDLNLVIEMADVADDRLVLHPLHVLERDDVDVARGRDVDVAAA